MKPVPWIGAGLCLIAVGAGAINARWINTYPALVQLMTFGLLVLFLCLVGIGVNGCAYGVLIDNRNRVSLSKFQMAAWTVLVIGALICFCSFNLLNGPADSALVITIPDELLVALGISATSLVAAPIVLSMKANQTPSAANTAKAQTAVAVAGGNLNATGNLFGRDDPKHAALKDMMVGEELCNFDTPDLSKIQQLLVSLVLLGVYGFAVIDSLTKSPHGSQILSFPTLSQNFVWLLGISHASYLAYTAAPHSQQ